MARWNYLGLGYCPDFGIPYAPEGCAAPLQVYNEGVHLMDLVASRVALSASRTFPVGNEPVGTIYIVNNNGLGEFRGKDLQLAGKYDIFRDGNPEWYFVKPRPGMIVYVADLGSVLHFNGTTWVVGPT